MDVNSLAHAKWECKYHLVFAPKYRRQVIYKDIKADVGIILRTLCERKGIEIIEAECCPDHIHMLVMIPPKYSISEIVGYLKGKSTLMIFEKHANLKYKYGNDLLCNERSCGTYADKQNCAESILRLYVILTSRGYTVMGFDNHRQEWSTVDFCPTPEALRDSLLDAYENFRMMEITGGDRDLTATEEALLAEERDALTALCEKEAAKCSS